MAKFNDMTGQKIGKLTVEEFSHRSDKCVVYWKCRCDCGQEKITAAGELQRAKKNNTNISCGCAKFKDISGKKYNMLTAVKLAEVINGNTYWECLCDCGTIKNVQLSALASGDIKSCGCLKRGKTKDVTGQKFGRLTAIRRVGTKNNNARWECLCECGTVKEYALNQISSGKTQSCGCLQKELTIKRSTIHGHSTRENMTDTYVIWCGIITRCENLNEPAYKNYGGRGIKMCERWRNSFEAFLEDMGERPSKNHSIDRIDNEGDYEPNNCKWATRAEQARNTRNNVWLEYKGEKKILTDWATEYNIPQKTLWYRIQHAKWDMEKALTTPTTKCKN